MLTFWHSLVEPLCTQVSPIVCKRKSLLLHHRRWRSRSLHHPRENTPSGLVVLFWHLCLLSNRCGSQSKSTTSPDLPLSTASVSKVCNYQWFLIWRACANHRYYSVSRSICVYITNFTNLIQKKIRAKQQLPVFCFAAKCCSEKFW